MTDKADGLDLEAIKQRVNGRYRHFGTLSALRAAVGDAYILIAEVERLRTLLDNPTVLQAPCRTCGGSGFIAQKRFIDDGYGEVESCPACDERALLTQTEGGPK